MGALFRNTNLFAALHLQKRRVNVAKKPEETAGLEKKYHTLMLRDLNLQPGSQ
jgi:hypothetical protein